MKLINPVSYLIFLLLILSSCQKTKNKSETDHPKAPDGMVWVPKKEFLQGAKNGDPMAMRREKPAHLVEVDGFFIDKTEVTNKEFKAFVDATDYVTLAERPIQWEELKEQLPPNTPKPPDSIMRPGSLIFNEKARGVVNMNNYFQWWTWKIGANWRHPKGPNSTIDGKDNHPVVHVAYEDALAYCEWANRRLPTEAEWESAALGELDNTIFTWGNESAELIDKANTWQGEFPVSNLAEDGFIDISKVKSYPPNSIGLYDMLGNVWEITSDLFDVEYYIRLDKNKVYKNPKGSNKSYSPQNPFEVEHVIKGGSFLCHESYCASFRISARMGNAEKTSSDHVGFRTVVTPKMLEQEDK